MFIIAPINQESHINALFEIMSIAEDEHRLRYMRTCSTPQELAKINIFTDIVEGGMKAINNGRPTELFELENLRSRGMKAVLEEYYHLLATKTWR